MLGALEDSVFHKVSHPEQRPIFVAAADIYSHTEICHTRAARLMNDFQPIGQNVCLKCFHCCNLNAKIVQGESSAKRILQFFLQNSTKTDKLLPFLLFYAIFVVRF